MAAEGCHLYQDYRHMAFMGFAAVLRNLGEIRRNFRIAREALLNERPDVLILIDYPSFNLKMAEFCHRHLPETKIIYYIPPKVWAWKRWRIHQIARLCNEIWAIFPFEPAYYARYGYSCTYVGNPTAEELKGASEHSVKRQKTIAILPGSRKSEVSHCLPKMLEAARRIEGYRIVVTAAPGLDDALYAPYLHPNETLTRDTYDAVRTAEAAIVNSGTATLETALLGCPQVAVYHLACSWLIGILRWAQPLVFSIRYFTLVNILADKQVIRELVANEFTTDKIEAELRQILFRPDYRDNMRKEYQQIRAILDAKNNK